MAEHTHAKEETEDKENESTNGHATNRHNLKSNGHKPKVCRRLDFGSDDQLEVDIESMIQQDLEKDKREAMEKWNFDFENEVPLEGDWVWEKVPTQPPEAKQVMYSIQKKQRDNRNV